MASEVLCGIIQGAAEMLSTLLPPSTTASSGESPNGATEDLKQLELTMKRIQSVILDAGDRDVRDRSEKHRLEELKEVALDAEDLVGDYAYEVLHAKIEARNQMNRAASSKGKEVNITDLSSIDVSVPVSEEMMLRARRIGEKFDEIVKGWESLRWMEIDGVRRCCHEMVRHGPTSSLIHEPSVHGRYQDKEKVIEILLLENDESNVTVLPIVGMGGLGKSTLAQLVYNDPRVSQHFDLKGWVWAFEKRDVKSLTEMILTSLTKNPCAPMQLDDLQTTLRSKVKGKNLLLVLDDVWNEIPGLWNSWQIPLKHSKSSKIIVTTRSETVAKIMQTVPFYPLTFLSEEDSWQLFKQVAFENGDPSEHDCLLEIGRAITLKFKGLPLAVKAIAYALHFELDEEMWRYILESDLWQLEAGKNELFPALQLSYDCMPALLKQCFMYFSLFPKEFAFSKDQTVKLWASLGFLESKGRRSIEDVGRRYFDDLHQRSMIQRVKYDEKTSVFVLHDIMHELAEFVAGESFLTLHTQSLSPSSSKVRYLSLLVTRLPNAIDFGVLQRSSSLRILQILNRVNKWLGKDISVEIHEGLFRNFKCLRALDFSYTGIKALPDSIGDLKQLRYLGLANTKIENLPDSVCSLYNLQTLDLLGCPLRELPKEIKNLVNLRHLNMEKWSYIRIPYGTGYLTNLVTLGAFNVERVSGCAISELRHLNNLYGELCITGLDNVRDVTDAVLADLQSKKGLHFLTLVWSSGDSISKTLNPSPERVKSRSQIPTSIPYELVIEALRPPINLQVLEIYRYPGLSFPRWLGDISYSKLVQIVLDGNRDVYCQTCLPALGRLPLLKNLSIQYMLKTETVGHEFCGCDAEIKGFQSLISLEFKFMPTWSRWLGFEKGEFSSLNTLKMIRCYALKCLPHPLSASLTKLVINHCGELSGLPFLPSLASLTLMGQISKLIFHNMHLPSLQSLEVGFSHNIWVIQLKNCILSSLEALVIKRCKNLENVVGLSDLKSLRELELDGCQSLMLSHASRKGVGPPPFLQALRITNCRNLRDWDQSNFGDKSKNIEQAGCEKIKAQGGENLSENQECSDEDTSGSYKLLSDFRDDESIVYYSKDQPLNGRKRYRKNPSKELSRSFDKRVSLEDKGKQIYGYSSGSSIRGSGDSELGYFGATSGEVD